MVTGARGFGPVLLGLALGWGAGNIGPVVAALVRRFDVSLAEVGLLSGTVYFGAVMLATPLAVPLAARVGVVRAGATACALMAAGHLVFAMSPAFAGLLVARIIVGAGCAVALIGGPVIAREFGGMRLLGFFGGAITFGVAAALGLGSALEDVGISWRVSFVVSSAVCLLPLLFMPNPVTAAPAPRADRTFFLAAIRAAAVWRLLALFIAANGVPLIVGAWLVAYLTREADLRPAVAGALAFAVFGLTTVVRPLGARVARRPGAFGVLAGGGSLLAAAGLIALAAADSLPLAMLAVALMGVGFAAPYAVMVDAAQGLFPERRAAALALLQTGPNVVPMIVIPLVGKAADHGDAPLGFILLAAFVVLAGVANLAPPAARATSGG